MKFITSTHLKQWADTKDCQQTLPELVKKLIDASVANVDRLSFPSGDATSLSGWDGIVSCQECIDLVPLGVSLWECGATENVKRKIDDDYDKRTKDSLGYVKADSTFVFVTPRIWEGVNEWIDSHLGDWKKVVVYTAIELENWIDKTPTVGMWLAQKLNILPSRGFELPETYWNKWAQGKEFILPFEIVLPGREAESKQVVDACKEANPIILQSLTQNEGIAFAIASVMICEESEKLKDKMVVVTEKNAYDDLVQHYDNLILLTTLTDGIQYTTKRGHTVIVASTPADQKKGAVILPLIEKDGFVAALEKVGIDEAKARKIALDTARDINVFRRREEIVVDQPRWIESLPDLLPAFLVGKWIDDFEGDRAIMEVLSGMKYDQYEEKLYTHLLEEETPLIHIGNTWRIRSPYESINIIQNRFTPSILDIFKEVCNSLIIDDDPEATEKLNPDAFQFRQYKQKYSGVIKEGAFQNLCLMSIVDNSVNGKLRNWVDDTMKELLNDWDLQRFLSNKHHFTALAEASPSCFLDFMEHLPKEILDVVFKPRKPKYSLFGWEISYTEVLFALEMLAWDAEYLNRVTALLLRFSEYENESNYVNKPENSLHNIFRFFLPQTHVSFEDGMAILRAYSTKYGNTIYKICKKNCESLNGGVLDSNQYFRWRLFGDLKTTKYVNQVTIEQLHNVVNLMLQCCDYSPETIVDLIKLSSHVNMNSVRMMMLKSIREHLVGLDEMQIVADGLRENITHHLLYPDSTWSLNENELKPYQDLLEEIEPKDLMNKYAWLFEKHYIQLPDKKEFDFDRKQQELLTARTKALQEIIYSNGQDGVWAFINMVKCPESLSGSLVSIYHDQLIYEICQKYKTKEIGDNFVKSYLFALCRENVANYIVLAKQIVESDRDMVIVLYAPRYVEELAKIASDFGEEVKRCYWESIDVGFVEGNFESVVRELLRVNRYSEAIEIMCSLRETLQMSDLEIVNVLYSYLSKRESTSSQMNVYYIKILLERLDKSEDPEVIRILVLVEFFLFRVLEHDMDMAKTRFVKELSRNPELLIQLVELAYVPDDGNIEQMEGIAAENRKVMGECAFYILFFGKNLVSFKDSNGTIDETFMCQYIEQLYKLAEERKRLGVINNIIGSILGDIPRDENYPPKALCELVERLNSDEVDRHISIRIINSRGVTSRSYKEGGGQERAIVAKFEKYKEKTKLLYPRMTKILDSLIKNYSEEATRMDDEASIEDLEY